MKTDDFKIGDYVRIARPSTSTVWYWTHYDQFIGRCGEVVGIRRISKDIPRWDTIEVKVPGSNIRPEVHPECLEFATRPIPPVVKPPEELTLWECICKFLETELF